MEINRAQEAAEKRGLLACSGDFAFSDHASNTFALAKNIDVLSWNILNKCQSSASFSNTTYKINETPEEYGYRLVEAGKAIAQKLAANPRIALIALQEAPHGAQLLALLCPAGWVVTCHPQTPSLVSFHNPEILNVSPAQLPQLAQKITPDLAKQSRRYDVLEVQPINGGASIIYVNAHFACDFHPQGSSQERIVKALVASRTANIMVAGDFNCQIENFPFRNTLAEHGAYIASRADGTPRLSQIDMAVYNYDPRELVFCKTSDKGI